MRIATIDHMCKRKMIADYSALRQSGSRGLLPAPGLPRPYWLDSPHTAQAADKVSLVRFPANLLFISSYVADRLNCLWYEEHTILRRLLLSPLSTNSISFHANGNPLKVSLLTEPGMSHPISPPLQPTIRFFQHPVPARQSRRMA